MALRFLLKKTVMIGSKNLTSASIRMLASSRLLRGALGQRRILGVSKKF